MDGSLVGGRVQRLAVGWIGRREVAFLQVRVPGETVHVVVASGLGVGTVGAPLRDRLRALVDGPSPAQARWRARLEGARVTSVAERVLRFAGAGPLRASDAGGALALESDEDASSPDSGSAPDEKADAAGTDGAAREAWSARGERIAAALEREGSGGKRDGLRRALAKAGARIDRRVESVRGDLAKMNRAQADAERARLFVAEAARAPRGATVLRAVDWTSGEARDIEIALDPSKGAREQIDALFKRARRLKDGAAFAHARLADAEGTRDRLAALARDLADPAADLAAIEARARAAAPRDFKLTPQAPGGTRAPDAPRPPHRTFTGRTGAAILVGRGAAQNDALTLHVAKPWDLWLHAKNRAGAHVVVPLAKGASCPAEVLVDAAHLAAHFSDAKDEGVVEVQYTPRRYLRKPRGAAPGAVLVDREKIIVLRCDEETLRRLLAAETL